MPPPRRSSRLQRPTSGSPSGSGLGSRSASPPPRRELTSTRAHFPRKRARMRLSEAEELQRSRNIEQVIDYSADDKTEIVSALVTPSPAWRSDKRDERQLDAPTVPTRADKNVHDERQPENARGRPPAPAPGLLLPFLIGSLAILLAMLSIILTLAWPAFSFNYNYPFRFPPAPPLRLECALPLLTAHVRAVSALLPHARDLQHPALDHLAVRELRDAARNTDNAVALADALDALSERLTAAKMRALDLGVALWLAGRVTHNELAHALALASSSTSAPMSTVPAAAAVASATGFLSSSASDLHSIANDTARALHDAYTLGIALTASPAFAGLLSSIGKTPRSRWLGGVGGDMAGLRGSVQRAQEAVRRAGALGCAARDLAKDVAGIIERLRGVFGADDPLHPPKAHADPAQMGKLASELRVALEGLAGQVAQVQPDTG